MYDKYNKKILEYKNDDLFIIFYIPECRYCISAMDLLKSKNLSFKGYNINNFKGGMDELLHYLVLNKQLTNFNENHKTKPIIFYKGNFIGGFTDLEKFLSTFI